MAIIFSRIATANPFVHFLQPMTKIWSLIFFEEDIIAIIDTIENHLMPLKLNKRKWKSQNLQFCKTQFTFFQIKKTTNTWNDNKYWTKIYLLFLFFANKCTDDKYRAQKYTDYLLFSVTERYVDYCDRFTNHVKFSWALVQNIVAVANLTSFLPKKDHNLHLQDE